jgi:ABC-type multidrug transport system fused ATPase/permease subunit
MAEIEIPQETGSKEDKKVGIKIAIIAVIMAIVSSYGKNAANDMIINEVKASNGYAWYQAKRIRSALNDQVIGQIDIDQLGQPTDAQREAMGKLKKKLQEKNAEYKKENEDILKEADNTKAEAALAGKKNDAFDRAEIALQVAVVLCSLTLLTGSQLFSRAGVLLAFVGVALAFMAFFKKPDPPKTEPAPPTAAAPAQPAGK